MKCLLYQQFLLTSHRVNRIPMPLCTAALFPQDRSSNETNHLHSISQFRNKDKLSCCAGLTKQQQEPDKYTFEPHKGRSIRDLVVRAWKLQKTCRSVRDQLSHDGVRETIVSASCRLHVDCGETERACLLSGALSLHCCHHQPAANAIVYIS